MNKKNPIVHFEIPVDNIERAQAFYKDIFDWEFNTFDMPGGATYYGVTTTKVDKKSQPTSPGINGGMMKRVNEGQPFMNYIQVVSINEILKAVKEKGGVIALPKTEIAPGMGWIATFKDTEENLMGLHELAPQMK